MKFPAIWRNCLAVCMMTMAAACSNAAAFVDETQTPPSTLPAQTDTVEGSPTPEPTRQASATVTRQPLKTARSDVPTQFLPAWYLLNSKFKFIQFNFNVKYHFQQFLMLLLLRESVRISCLSLCRYRKNHKRNRHKIRSY